MSPGIKNFFFLCVLCVFACNKLKAQVINIESKRFLNDTNGWVGTSDLYFQLTKNTQQVISLGSNVRIQYAKHEHKFLILNDISFVKAGPTDFVNSGYQHFRYSYKINKIITSETFVQAQYNGVLKMKFRGLVGSGFRFRVFKRENFKLYAAAAYMYEHEEDYGVTEQFNVSRLSTYASFTWVIKDNIEFSSTTFYQPSFADFKDYRVAGDGAFEFGLTKKLSFKLSYNFLYDTRQPKDIPNFVYAIKNGLSFKF